MGTMSYEYMRNYRIRRTTERRNLAIKYLGGKCTKCKVVDNLEFDHVDPKTKLYEIATHLWDYSWNKLLLELNKCQLLCISCHKEKTMLEKSVDHGGGKTGKRNCYCNQCKPLKQKYMRVNSPRW